MSDLCYLQKPWLYFLEKQMIYRHKHADSVIMYSCSPYLALWLHIIKEILKYYIVYVTSTCWLVTLTLLRDIAKRCC